MDHPISPDVDDVAARVGCLVPGCRSTGWPVPHDAIAHHRRVLELRATNADALDIRRRQLGPVVAEDQTETELRFAWGDR